MATVTFWPVDRGDLLRNTECMICKDRPDEDGGKKWFEHGKPHFSRMIEALDLEPKTKISKSLKNRSIYQDYVKEEYPNGHSHPAHQDCLRKMKIFGGEDCPLCRVPFDKLEINFVECSFKEKFAVCLYYAAPYVPSMLSAAFMGLSFFTLQKSAFPFVLTSTSFFAFLPSRDLIDKTLRVLTTCGLCFGVIMGGKYSYVPTILATYRLAEWIHDPLTAVVQAKANQMFRDSLTDY